MKILETWFFLETDGNLKHKNLLGVAGLEYYVIEYVTVSTCQLHVDRAD